MTRKTVAVLFGGQSSEHEVSCVSAQTVIRCINEEKYKTVLIGITKEGHWLQAQSLEDVAAGSWQNSKVQAIVSPDATEQSVLFLENGQVRKEKIDVIFPVLHGMYGEDGTIQGLFEMAAIPYVGCGVLASAVSMDKFYTKIIVDTLGIRQAAYVAVFGEELSEMDMVLNRIESKLKYPVFVKPSRAGSSQGVSKAENREMLVTALNLAAKHDRKILVEETIIGREVECPVLGYQQVKTAGVGEVVAAADFYDYDAKYNNAESKTDTDPKLPVGKKEEIQEAAVSIFKAVDGFGLSRVDFFVEEGSNEVVFNEINTLPGFTSISMYPMLWKARGMETEQLIETLIEMAMER